MFRTKKLFILTASFALFWLLALPAVAHAAGTIPVDTTVDEFGGGGILGCSLREAIQSANTDSDFGGCVRTGTPPYTISLPPGTYLLTQVGASEDENATGDLDIGATLTISGTDATTTTIQAGLMPGIGIDRVVHITQTVAVSITDVTIEHGTTPTADESGAGVANTGGGSLTLIDSVIIHNVSLGDEPGEGGGGIFNDVGGTLTLSNTNIYSNTAIVNLGNGGGILNAGTATISNSTIANNGAARAGGGIENNGGTLTFTNVDFANNSTGINGGAVHISGSGAVSITNGTAISNTAGAEGGGLWNSAAGTLSVDGTTISGNTASGNDADQGGGGLFNDGGTMTVSNATITDNIADGTSGSGGGIQAVPGSTVTIDSSMISGNNSNRAGGGIEVNATVTDTVMLTMTNVSLTSNNTGSSPGNGGGLHITGPGTVSITGGTVFSNTASAEGGGLWNSASGTLSVDGTTISGNTASGNDTDQGGGGLFNDGGTMTVSNVTIEDNVADGTSGSGGGILNNGGTLSVTDSTISGNTSNRAGGGIEDNAGVIVTLGNVDFSLNETGSSPGNGGGLHITGPGTVSITGGTVFSNTASAEGGGLWNSASGTLSVDGTTISGNTASGNDTDQGGGGLFNDGGTMTVSNVTIEDNVADGTSGSGGGILAEPGSVVIISDSGILFNTANRAGGGIEVHATVSNTAALTLTTSALANNSASSNPGNGGGLHITGPATVVITGTGIAENTASAEGGGLWNSASGTLTVDKSTINGNQANGASLNQGGGGIFNDGGIIYVSNSTLSGNSAATNGGGVFNDGTADIINVTIYENSANIGTGGFHHTHFGTIGSLMLNMVNTIIAHTSATGPDCNGVTAGNNNLDSDGTCGADLTDDPMLDVLAFNGGDTLTHALLEGSPAVDEGSDSVCAMPPINNMDQRGEARPMGTACDLGAYESAFSKTYVYLFPLLRREFENSP